MLSSSGPKCIREVHEEEFVLTNRSLFPRVPKVKHRNSADSAFTVLFIGFVNLI